ASCQTRPRCLPEPRRGETPKDAKIEGGNDMTGLVTRRLFPLAPRSVLRDFESVHREVEALFGDVFGARADRPDWAARIETSLKDDTMHVRADLPGVDPKNVDLSVEKDVLTIRGERKTEHTDATYCETSYGRFERRIRLPEGTDAEKVTAKY